MANPNTFHPFPRLPTELRLQIWAFAIHESFIDRRPLSPEITIIRRKAKNFVYNVEVIHSERRLPTIFWVNRESRHEAARIDGGAWYHIDITKQAIVEASDPKLYFNGAKEMCTLCKWLPLGDGFKGFGGLHVKMMRGAYPAKNIGWRYLYLLGRGC